MTIFQNKLLSVFEYIVLSVLKLFALKKKLFALENKTIWIGKCPTLIETLAIEKYIMIEK